MNWKGVLTAKAVARQLMKMKVLFMKTDIIKEIWFGCF